MIVLASASGQRKNLLKQIGIDPYVLSVPTPEKFVGSDVHAEIQSIARCKVEAALPHIETARALSTEKSVWAIGADTIILIEEQILGKPGNPIDAAEMIGRLSGRTHSVITGVCVWHTQGGRHLTDVCETKVEFAKLSQETVNWYVSTGEWNGAAGGYRIQGSGACIVEAIHGSYSNVVGLPLETLYGMLGKLNYRLR